MKKKPCQMLQRGFIFRTIGFQNRHMTTVRPVLKTFIKRPPVFRDHLKLYQDDGNVVIFTCIKGQLVLLVFKGKSKSSGPIKLVSYALCVPIYILAHLLIG